MVWPRTNCCPISRMTRATAWRMTGSPRRLMAPRKSPAMPVSGASSTCPVTKSAQVDALTKAEWLSPRCLPHSDGAILSSIKASMVAASGTRNSASARHIKAMPSSEERPYSAKNNSITEGLASARSLLTMALAWREISARASGLGASVAKFCNTSGSEA